MGARPQAPKEAGPSAKQAAVKSAAKLKPAASVPGTLVGNVLILAPIEPRCQSLQQHQQHQDLRRHSLVQQLPLWQDLRGQHRSLSVA